MDADRLDYLDRDLYMAGVGPRIDAAKIRESYQFIDGRLGVRESAADSLIHALATRAWAYKRIYNDRKCARGIAMVQLAVHSDKRFAGLSPQAQEALHASSDAEFFRLLGSSADERVGSLIARLHGPTDLWYPCVYELRGADADTISAAQALYSRKDLLEALCQGVGLGIYWFQTPRRLKQLQNPRYPSFPLNDGTDLFSRPVARANFDDFPQPWVALYAESDSPRHVALAQELVERVL
jgi:hypothetical protein